MVLLVLAFACGAAPAQPPVGEAPLSAAALRQAYRQPPARWPAAWLDPGVEAAELAPAPPPALTPAQRPQAALGRRLFFDRRLSAHGTVACADCHRPGQGWTVNTPLARGHAGQAGRRNPIALFTAAAQPHWGWDGAAPTLAARALAPLADPAEMGHPTLDAAVARALAAPGLGAALAHAARAHHGGDAAQALGAALAAFIATLDAPTRLDRFLRGEGAALSNTEIHGLHLFRTQARCLHCHHGPWLTDGRFHNLGLSSFGEPSQDLGRHGATGRCEDAGAFRTPSLRHVGRTGPYMHHGLFDTLEGVVHLYARGGGEVRARNAREAAQPLFPCAARRSPHLRPLALTRAEAAALAAFLRAL